MSVSPPLPQPTSSWAAVTPQGTDYPRLTGAVTTDVVIIGAGLTGLTAALHLRRAGARVVVLEAADPGWGASGHGSGIVAPALPDMSPDVIITRHRAAGERFVGLLNGSAQAVFATITDEGIDAEAEQTGWIEAVHAPNRLPLTAARVTQWAKAGANVSLLSSAEIATRLGSTAWAGGWAAPSGGHVNPLALVRGLARAVTARGGAVHAASPAAAFGRAGSRWVVTAPQGRVDARALIVATNGTTGRFSPRLAPLLARETIPTARWLLATAPLPVDLRRALLPARSAVSEARGDRLSLRYDARHRLVVGGAVAAPGNAAERIKPLVAERLGAAFPQLAALPGGIVFEHVWSGREATTRDALPHIHLLGTDGYAWVGGDDAGPALAMAIGKEFARGILGVPRSELALPFTDPDPFPLHGLANRLLPPWHLISARWRDNQTA